MKKVILLPIALMFVLTISKAQSPIPNNGFENWTTSGSYDTPDGWANLNSLTNAASVYTCQKGMPGPVGASYMKLTSKTVTGFGVVPGIAVCGTLNTTTMQGGGGFPFTGRPQSFTGKWQHMIFGSSQGSVIVTLTKWNTSTNTADVVGTATQTLSGMAMSWANFTINFTYQSSDMPDSCNIVLSASGNSPTNNDYLWVDNLEFAYASGISTPVLNNSLSIYPNPSNGNELFIRAENQNLISGVAMIYSLNGKLVEQTALNKNNALNVSDLENGEYLISFQTNNGNVNAKFVKQ